MPDDVEALKAALAAATFRADQAEVARLGARDRKSDDQALIAAGHHVSRSPRISRVSVS